jgi:formylglycine-generating enzyme required for sulfatase activity
MPRHATICLGSSLLTLVLVIAGCGKDDATNPLPPPPQTDVVFVAAGSFRMGSPDTEPGRDTDEVEHLVTLTRGFYMSRCEVTESQWVEVMGGNDPGGSLPKTAVNWYDAVAYCNARSVADGLTPAYTIEPGSDDVAWNQSAKGWRLPTEAEWEYACRAGADATAFANGALTQPECATLDPILDQVGWYCGNSGEVRHPVGTKAANAWGLHDLHGNVYEWCWDLYSSQNHLYASTDPLPEPGNVNFWYSGDRVIRGGSVDSRATACRCATRWGYGPYETYGPTGFRMVRTAD